MSAHLINLLKFNFNVVRLFQIILTVHTSLCDYEFFPTAQNRIALRGPDGPCKGHLEVYNDGKWGLVCYHGWNSKNGEVVCRSLGCGKHVESGHNKDSSRPPPQTTKFWMDEVKCSGSENNLWDCKKPRDTQCEADNYITVKCSGTSDVFINLGVQTKKKKHAYTHPVIGINMTNEPT